jgi:maltose-binding protein MalE
LKETFEHVKKDYFMPLAPHFREVIFQMIQKERAGQEVPSDAIKKAINVFELSVTCADVRDV